MIVRLIVYFLVCYSVKSYWLIDWLYRALISYNPGLNIKILKRKRRRKFEKLYNSLYYKFIFILCLMCHLVKYCTDKFTRHIIGDCQYAFMKYIYCMKHKVYTKWIILLLVFQSIQCCGYGFRIRGSRTVYCLVFIRVWRTFFLFFRAQTS